MASYVYAYTSNGNITSVTQYAYTTGTLGTATNTVTYGYNSTNADRLISYNGQSITYDAIGNPLNYRGMFTSWTQGRRLASLTKNGVTSTYTYNADGIRTSKTVGGVTTEYALVDGKLVKATNASGYVAFLFDENGRAIGFTASDNAHDVTCYYEFNAQGDVVALYDKYGTLQATYRYDAWGKCTVYTASGSVSTSATFIGNINPIRYRGYFYDTETGLYYLNSRYYDPETGRFINIDNQISTGSDLTGLNLFAYCGNNPMNRIDPTGEAWWHWAIGAAVVAACAVATVVTCGGFAAAATAVCCVANGVAATTTASTIAAGAFIGSATVCGMAALSAASTSNSVQEFNDQGNWETVEAIAIGAVFNGVAAYATTQTQTTTVYRSVSDDEARDIKNTNQFNLSPNGMECKQFGFNLSETKTFGNMIGQNTVVSAEVPTNILNQLSTVRVDESIFRAGTLTVYEDQLGAFNQAVSGTIKFIP